MAQDYDVTLKLLFRKSAGVALRQLTGGAVAEWLDVELPRVENLRVDLLARMHDGSYTHIELQSINEDKFPRRELTYYDRVTSFLDIPHVRQVALYIGREPLRMPDFYKTPSLRIEFEWVDARDLEPEPLLESDDLGDNLIARLTRADQERVTRKVLERLAKLKGEEQRTAAMQFVILSNLRETDAETLEEVRKYMRPLVDLTEGSIFGPSYRKGLDEGEAKGEAKGKAKGERALVLRLLEKRFGPLPAHALQRVEGAHESELEQLGLRIIDAATLDEVFRSSF